MCGIFGYIGKQCGINLTIEGLKKLEYRGYDSAGIATIENNQVLSIKDIGKIAHLENLVAARSISLSLAIGHTRWATHGAPSSLNAHPHTDSKKTLMLVHNGIIENYQQIRSDLIKNGATFETETDSEVVAQLIASLYKGDILDAVYQAIDKIEGSYAICLIHQEHPKQLIAFTHQSPLVLGLGQRENFIASDAEAFLEHTQEVVYLSDHDVCVIEDSTIHLYDQHRVKKQYSIKKLIPSDLTSSKEDFDHYTLKEIFEQPQTLKTLLNNRFDEDYGVALFPNLKDEIFTKANRILILGCGSSWHAGFLGAYLLEEFSRIPTQVEISSEYRYQNPIVQDDTLVIAISQSGETADTLAALRELKAKGAKILGICNRENTTLCREADEIIYLKAGLEIGVCSTKALTSQMLVFSLLSLYLGRMRHLSKQEGIEFIQGLKKLPLQIEQILSQNTAIKKLSQKYTKYSHFFFLGRQTMYPTALEGALKLKEISYLHSHAYPGGELKHGPIALIDDHCPTIALCANEKTYTKILSNLMEIKARKGPILAIAYEGAIGLEEIVDDVFYVPKNLDALSPITVSVVLQLFAYHVANELGCEIDQPKNLAKSVTVE